MFFWPMAVGLPITAVTLVSFRAHARTSLLLRAVVSLLTAFAIAPSLPVSPHGHRGVSVPAVLLLLEGLAEGANAFPGVLILAVAPICVVAFLVFVVYSVVVWLAEK